MFCPQCNGEFVERVRRCPDCEIDLVAELEPKPEPRETELDLVTVVATGDPTLLSIAQSALDDAKVSYLEKGEGLQNLFAGGRMGLGFNPVTGPVELQVAEEDLERAREALDSLEPLELSADDPSAG